MPRRMSCAFTVSAVHDRSKTVTRRDVTTWLDLRPGDPLTLVEKAMGLKKGAKQVVLAQVEIVSTRMEPLSAIDYEPGGCLREGFPEMSVYQFMDFWRESHCYPAGTDPVVRRIEWRYL